MDEWGLCEGGWMNGVCGGGWMDGWGVCEEDG